MKNSSSLESISSLLSRIFQKCHFKPVKFSEIPLHHQRLLEGLLTSDSTLIKESSLTKIREKGIFTHV